MPLRRTDLPTDPDQLVELVLQLDADNERLRATLHSINNLHFGVLSPFAPGLASRVNARRAIIRPGWSTVRCGA